MATTPTERAPLTRIGGLCLVEMLVWSAYTGVRSVIPLYIMQADEPGGLHFTAGQRGNIFAGWFAVQTLLPMFSGGFADRYGRKRVVALSILLISAGYFLMAHLRDYGTFLCAVLLLASGTAVFKPALQGALAAALSKNTASAGWGIFFWVVNVGALFGPPLATLILGPAHTAESWRTLYWAGAGLVLLNLPILALLPAGSCSAGQRDRVIDVLRTTIRDAVQPRLLAYMLIMCCFWMAMWQFWDLHPNFIRDWNDSSGVAASLRSLPPGLQEQIEYDSFSGRNVQPQILLWTNQALIVALVIPLSWVVRKMRTLRAMVIGIFLVIVGLVMTGLTADGWVLLAGIAVFTSGEMLTAPKHNEYLGLIAPTQHKSLYLGYANIPVGIGGAIGAKLAGYLYAQYGEKAILALRYLAEHHAGGSLPWDGSISELEQALGTGRDRAFLRLQEVLGLSGADATRLLWETYHPQYFVWGPFILVGFLALLGAAVFARRAARCSEMNP